MTKSRGVRLAVNVEHMRAMRNVYKIFIRKPEGKRLLEGHRHIWEDNIRMDIREIGWECVDWMHLSQARDQWLLLMNLVMNLQVP